MTPLSIRSHLAQYSIFEKRRTTINHAFASALAFHEEYDKEKVEKALKDLGQTDLRRLTCVYCSREAKTWDHLENLVSNGRLSGFGHQLGNLVPACGDCNSEKTNRPFRDFVRDSKRIAGDRNDLIKRLENHLTLATPIEIPSPESSPIVRELFDVQQQILDLMVKADELVAQLSPERNG
jgi:5-methylcytosine-specific restriction endonuclease McrA